MHDVLTCTNSIVSYHNSEITKCFFLDQIMAIIKSVFSLLLITLIAFSLLFVPLYCTGRDFLKVCEFDAIYQLGDSISDTGNLILQNPSLPFFQFPYGKTYFKNATGRCSNGLLMIDFIGKNHIKLKMLMFIYLFIIKLMPVCQKVAKKILNLLLEISIRLFF